MSDYKKLQQNAIQFRDDRDWRQYHHPAAMIVGLWVEVGELAEHFMYLDDDKVVDHLKKERQLVGEELVDVLYWIFIIANDLEIDLGQSFLAKMTKNLEAKPSRKRPKVAMELPTTISSLDEMTHLVRELRAAWSKNPNPHPRYILLKLFEEMGELAEHFRPDDGASFAEYFPDHKEELAHELIDVLICDLLLFHYLKYDIPAVFAEKMVKNNQRYPVQN